MSISSADASETPSYPTPYDPTTLQQRIHREIVGISALSEFLAAFDTQGIVLPPSDDTTTKDTAVPVEQMSVQETKPEMIRIRLDDEFWVDMTPDQVTEFLRRKEACKSSRNLSSQGGRLLIPTALLLALRAVEERRENLAQLQEWMIRELQDMTGVAPEPTLDGQENGDNDAPDKLEETSLNVPNAAPETHLNDTAITEIIPSSATTSVQASFAASAPTEDTAQKLDDINSALAKFGTSMEQVLKLDPKAGDGTGTSAEGVEVGNDGTVSIAFAQGMLSREVADVMSCWLIGFERRGTAVPRHP